MAKEYDASPNAKYLEEDNVSNECKKVMLRIPRDKGWVCTHLFQYQGFWHTSRQLQGVLNFQAHFQAHDSDNFLVTTPKSGTTWLKALLFTLVNRHVPTPAHPLTTQNPHVLVPFLELKLYVDGQIPDLSSLPPPRLFATHLPVGSLPPSVFRSASKIVYLCRDPRDTFVSMWHFANKIRSPGDGPLPLEEALERFCRGVSLYGPFWDHVLGYWEESLRAPHRVLFLKYEELKADPRFSVRRLAEFLGCPFSEEEDKGGLVDAVLQLCSFDNLSSLEVNRRGRLDSGEENNAFFRRGEVGDFANYLTPKMIDKLDKITEEKLRASGLTF